MNNPYEYCKELSKNGDEKSIEELISLSIAKNRNIRESARMALRRTHKIKTALTILDKKIESETNSQKKALLLTTGIKIDRGYYLYRYLQFTGTNDEELRNFLLSVKGTCFNEKESNELKKYLIDGKIINAKLINLLNEKDKAEIMYMVLDVAAEQGINPTIIKILTSSKDYLGLLQGELRELVLRREEGTLTYATLLDLQDAENQIIICEFEKMSLIFHAVENNVWEIDSVSTEFKMISVAIKIKNHEKLNLQEFELVDKSISEELKGVHDGSNASTMLYTFLNTLSKIEYDYVEKN